MDVREIKDPRKILCRKIMVDREEEEEEERAWRADPE